MKRHKTNKKKLIVIIFFIIIFAVSTIYLIMNFYNTNKNKELYEDLEKDLALEEIANVNNAFVEKVKELQQENSDIKGWIKIENTNINYPILQTTNNEFYVNHNYKKEQSKYGSIFINYKSDITDINSNVIIYGHDMKDNQMFKELLNYENKEFYKSQPTIMIATDESEFEYEIVSVFKSRVFYTNEENVFRYYQYYNFDNEKIYNEYINNCKQIELYSTGVTANYGEQLITLITCEYSQENGRMVVVAKKK